MARIGFIRGIARFVMDSPITRWEALLPGHYRDLSALPDMEGGAPGGAGWCDGTGLSRDEEPR